MLEDRVVKMKNIKEECWTHGLQESFKRVEKMSLKRKNAIGRKCRKG